MNYKRQIGKYTVTAACSPDLKGQAQGLLEVVAKLDRRGPAIRAGTTIQFGWSLLKLQGIDQDLVIFEPDFEGDPVRQWKPQVENTLNVLTSQVGLLQALGLEGTDCRYRDQVLITKGCLTAEHIYLERREPSDAEDSGWYIGEVFGDAETPDEDDLDVIPVYQIYQQRPELMQVLSLPEGVMVIFRGKDLAEIFNQAGKRIWPASP